MSNKKTQFHKGEKAKKTKNQSVTKNYRRPIMIEPNGEIEFEFQGAQYRVEWKTISKGRYLQCQAKIFFWGKNTQWNPLGNITRDNMSAADPQWINVLSNTPTQLKQAIKTELGVQS